MTISRNCTYISANDSGEWEILFNYYPGYPGSMYRSNGDPGDPPDDPDIDLLAWRRPGGNVWNHLPLPESLSEETLRDEILIWMDETLAEKLSLMNIPEEE